MWSKARPSSEWYVPDPPMRGWSKLVFEKEMKHAFTSILDLQFQAAIA
jgi:hypothetical protein